MLCQELPFTEKIGALCIPKSSYPSGDFMNRYTATVQGWGKDYLERQGVYLTQVDLTIRKKSICNKEYERVRDSVKNHLMPNLSIDAMFCTDGNLREDAGTCYGDSGGPTIIK